MREGTWEWSIIDVALASFASYIYAMHYTKTRLRYRGSYEKKGEIIGFGLRQVFNAL